MKSELMGLKRKQEVVQVAEGVEVVVKELTAGEANKYQMSNIKMVNGKPVANPENAQAKLVLMSCYESDGTRMFSDADLEQVKGLPSTVIDKLYAVAERLNNGDAKN